MSEAASDDDPTGRTSASDVTADGLWAELVTAGLLGTERRDPPRVPADLMGGLLADVVDDAVPPDAASRMLHTVAVVTAARRAAFIPLAPAVALQPPPIDDRPVLPDRAVRIARTAITDWPVLEDEWLVSVIQHGWRLPPDVVVRVLERTRTDAARRVRALMAAGPIGPWLVGQFPHLEMTVRVNADLDPLQLPELPLPPDLAEMLGMDALTFARALTARFATDPPGPAQRQVLTNLLARCRPGVLLDAADALSRLSSGLAQALADLARQRAAMLDAVTTADR